MQVQPLNPQTEELKLAVAIIFAVHGKNKGNDVLTTDIVKHIQIRYDVSEEVIIDCINKLFSLCILTKRVNTYAPDFKEVESWTCPLGSNGQLIL